MRALFLGICFLVAFSNLDAQIIDPGQTYGQLFTDVQLKPVFPDGKTFVDCTPKQNPSAILAAYAAQKDMPQFDLSQFVKTYFNLPESKTATYHSDRTMSVQRHIEQLWEVLKRSPDRPTAYSSLIPLPHSYVVPGGRFREVYYWDSYFTMLGLWKSGKDSLVLDMVNNFAYLLNTYGFIPNGNRTYYLDRSQPPFFSLMLDLLAKIQGSYVYVTYQHVLLEEYKFWMRGQENLNKPGQAYRNVVRMPDGTILNRYWSTGTTPREESYRADVLTSKDSQEPDSTLYRNLRAAAESGMDFSSRWFDDEHKLSTIQTTNMVAVDLNSLLYHLELTIAKSYRLSGDLLRADYFEKLAKRRKAAILTYCWDPKEKFFTDWDIRSLKPSGKLSLAGTFPLFLHVSDSLKARSAEHTLQAKFLRSGGFLTTLIDNGQQWDAPNGWAPLEYVAIEGLRRYGFSDLASEAAHRWINLNSRVYKQTGKLLEKYNVVDMNLTAGGGEYALQDGFGWTNGVYLMLSSQFPEASSK